MNFENWISYRYLISKKGNKFLSFLNFISIAGVAIGVMSLIIVTGVMTGFGNNLREKIIGTTPHIAVEKETGVKDFSQLISEIKQIEEVTGASAYVQGNVFLETRGQALGLALRGVDPKTEADVTKVDEYLIKGKIEDLAGDSIVIGSELARYAGYKPGDTISLIAPGSGLAGKGWRYKLTIVGVFSSGMVDYDMSLVLVHFNKAQEIFHLPQNVATGIGVKLEDAYKANVVKKKIYEALGYSFLVKTWIDVNRGLFDALWLEKWGLFLILTLMILIASFNIISTLIVTVTSKVQDIGILKSVGTPNVSIRRIFTKLGMFIGSVGTFWGVVLGVVITYVLRTYVEVPKELYSIDRVPVELQLSDMLIIIAATMAITFLATIYPAAKAASLQPVDALRYE